MFQHAFVISVEADGAEKRTIVNHHITKCASDEALERNSCLFAFPDLSTLEQQTQYPSQTFVFILTDGCGSKRFGTCRRFLPQGTSPRFPACIVLLTVQRPEQHLLSQLLQVAENKVSYGCTCVPLLEAALTSSVPPQRSTADVEVCVSPQEEYRFSRPPERDNMFQQLVPLLHTVTSSHLVRLFSHLLHERRIIFCASSLQVLSNGVQSTLALLYPFSWQHVLVPVLPEGLVNFCCAPMPFVVGLLSHQLRELREMRHAMDDAVIFDLDRDRFLDDHVCDLSGDLNSIPEPYRVAIMHQVDVAKRSERNGSIKQGKMMARPFLAFFVQMFWNFKRFFGPTGFDKQAFIDSKSSPASRGFLADFVETQMACQFFQEYEKLQLSGRSARFAAFERLTHYVDQQFREAVRELENAQPRERFKRHMSRILPFSAAVMRKSSMNVMEDGAAAQDVPSFAEERNVEIVRKPDQVSSFGLPLSTMSRKLPLNSSPVPNRLAPQDMGSPMSPFKIRGKVDPGCSPCIFSPQMEEEEDFGEISVVHPVVHLERYLSQFFEVSSIAPINKTDAYDASFATADFQDNSDGTLEDDMQALAKLIQQSWAEFGDDQRPIITSPSSPYHTIIPMQDLDNKPIDVSSYGGDDTSMSASSSSLRHRLFNESDSMSTDSLIYSPLTPKIRK